jgi:diguanylate cyclase (GGDEF)-like protein
MGSGIYVLGAFLLGAATAYVIAAWRGRPRGGPAPPAAGGEQRTARRTTPRSVRASSLSVLRDSISAAEPAEARERELADDLRGYLGDVAVQHAATDAMLWIRESPSAPMNPVAWNHRGVPPATVWGTEQQRALVAWAASEGLVNFDNAGGRPSIAAARVRMEDIAALRPSGRADGAIVVHSATGLGDSREGLKEWLPRHAERLAQLVELQATRNAVARQNGRIRALMRSAQEIQGEGEQEALERRIADSVLEASGASFVSLVRWNALERRGVVRHATAAYPAPAAVVNATVEPTSLVGEVCREGNVVLWEDAREMARDAALYGRSDRVPSAGSFAILPLQRAKVTVGALVIGAAEPHAIRMNDLRTIALFAQLAASALEAAWEIEEVSRRSRTDQLTGLWNRRHFDETLVKVLAETDRFGGSCALVIADVDHFKLVNDTYGHEAGDAVLKTVAAVIQGLVRATDTAARIGGEEVCVILPQTTISGALELTERLRVTLEGAETAWRSGAIKVTASFGVATYKSGTGSTARARVFAGADSALYRAKREGRNCVRSAANGV